MAISKVKSKMVGIGIAVVIFLGLGASVFLGFNKPTVKEVDVTPLARTNVQRTVSSTGNIQSTQSENIVDMSGMQIWNIDVSIGEWVESGTQLCSLYSPPQSGQSSTAGGSSTGSSEQWEYITAPISGTVTAINISNGDLANGTLFTIENTGSLKIIGRVKEGDLADVKPGMHVTFKTEATGDEEYQGTVQSIAPTAVKADAAGATASTGQMGGTGTTPEFNTTISIDSDITGLLIGMKANLTIISDEHQNVYTVDYNAFTKDENGNPCLLAAVEDGENGTIVKEIPITTGIESDFAIEVVGDQLTDGMKIISNVDSVTVGERVTPKSVDSETK